MYTLVQAPIEQRIIKQCLKERLPLPDRIQNAPELEMGLELYYDAFWDLTSCRDTGWGVGPIPWTAIHEYARAYEYDSDQLDNLVYYVREMDLEFIARKSKKGGSSSATSNSSSDGWGSGRKG